MKFSEPIEKHFATEQKVPIRLSDYAPGIFVSVTSKKGMKKVIEKGLVKVNGTVAYTSTYINGGEVIELFESEEISNKPIIDLDLEILFEDDYLAIVNKPAGIVVSGNKSYTLENAFPLALKISEQPDALPRPLPAHRLDYPTSGALLVGKTANTITALNKLFENKKISKTYQAICQGKLPTGLATEGEIITTIKGKKAQTKYKIIQSVPSPKFGELHHIELYPSTGRRHQLRIHLSELGLPILGDQQYGKEGKVLLGKGLFLNASDLSFVHPFTNEKIKVATILPTKFTRVMGNKIKGQAEEE